MIASISDSFLSSLVLVVQQLVDSQAAAAA
jgi:hypothetical protein